jgi:hypothetical protein
MGNSLSWLAIRGKDPRRIYEELSLSPTGRFEDTPECVYCSAELDGDWWVILVNRYDPGLKRFVDRNLARETLQAVSTGCELIAVSVEEHVMASSAEGWTDGRQNWHIGHELEKGSEHLESSGTLPECFEDYRVRALERRRSEGADAADYVFSVPLEVAQHLCGFKHDSMPCDRFEILEPIPKPRSESRGRPFGRG